MFSKIIRRSFGCGAGMTKVFRSSVLFHDVGDRFGSDSFVEVIVDQRDRRTATAGQALDEFHTEFSIKASGRCAAETMMLSVRIKADRRTKSLFDA